jgi:hypothetical protein
MLRYRQNWNVSEHRSTNLDRETHTEETNYLLKLPHGTCIHLVVPPPVLFASSTDCTCRSQNQANERPSADLFFPRTPAIMSPSSHLRFCFFAIVCAESDFRRYGCLQTYFSYAHDASAAWNGFFRAFGRDHVSFANSGPRCVVILLDLKDFAYAAGKGRYRSIFSSEEMK